MRIPRIYQSDKLTEGATVALQETAARHVAQVLRLNSSDQLILFNGDGAEYPATIISIEKKQVVIKINERIIRSAESALKIHLGQALSRSEKMDWVIQKSVELGVTEITPVITERCAIKTDRAQTAKRMEHWEAIITSACEQCGRNIIPKIHSPVLLNEWVTQKTHTFGLLCVPTFGQPLKKFTLLSDHISVLIGPEGGLSENEIITSTQAGFHSIILGPRILRTETAAIAALSALQCYWGDF